MTKQDRLNRLSNSQGVIAAMAIDQRKSLRMMIAAAAGVPLDDISDRQLGEFKRSVVSRLTPHATAVLIDPEFGEPAMGAQASTCGLLLTYEMDGYENPRPNRMLALMPELSVRRLKELGADGVKILLSWTPFDDERANEAKKAMIERIGSECKAEGLPFFLEPVGYDPGGMDVKSAEYARRKPEIVIRTMQEFSQPRYRADVLKVEFPVNVSFVGTDVYSREQALKYYREADAAAGCVPYIYLSAGVRTTDFLESLRLASESGARFSGVLCGRATWQDGIPAYAQGGLSALERWLETDGVRNILAVNEALQGASAWHVRASRA